MRSILCQIESIDDMMAEIYKKKTYLERLRVAFDLWHSTKILLFNSLRWLHPDWTDKQIQKEVARRISHGAV